MKKIFRSFAAVIIAIVFMAGCSGVQVTPQTAEKEVVKLAAAAAVIYAEKNKNEVSVALPIIKDALAIAQQGKIDSAGLSAIISKVGGISGNDDVKTALALLNVEFGGLEVKTGTINQDVIDALSAIVAGLEQGAK